jgi:hypothetical protein
MPLSKITDHSAVASQSRLQTLREGMAQAEAVDRAIWIRAAEARLEELEFRRNSFQLEQFEEDEAIELEKLLEENGHKVEQHHH